MIKLSKEQIQSIIPLYEGHVSQELEYAYREEGPFGKMDVKVYADNGNKPSTLLFCGGFAGTCLYGDAENSEHDIEIKELILACFNKDTKENWVHLLSPGWESKLDKLFDGLISGKHYRMIHQLNKDTFHNMNWREKVPNGYTMSRFDTMSHEFIQKRDWQDFWHPESDRFGWFLIKDDETVSECTSVWVEKAGVETGCVEIGIDTKESYRRKGFAFLTSAAFIDDCLSRNLNPVWCCWDFREGSKELAEKLGFEVSENRRVIVLAQK